MLTEKIIPVETLQIYDLSLDLQVSWILAFAMYKYITMKEQQEVCRASIRNLDFRIFLQQFKTRRCESVSCSRPEYCPFYHIFPSEKGDTLSSQLQSLNPSSVPSYDHRRSPYGKLNRIVYQPKYCMNLNMGCQDDQCEGCHNQWEIDYHPLVFKTSVCQRFYDCGYQFCSRIHYDDYIHNQNNQAQPVVRFSEFFRFDILTFKVQRCQKQHPHDKNLCLYYHNSRDRRRSNLSQYTHIECTNVNCSLDSLNSIDFQCPYSHNKIQQLYHPTRYKSKFCEKYLKSRDEVSKNQDKNKNLGKNKEHQRNKGCPYGQFCSFAHEQSQVSFQLIHKMEKNLQFHLFYYKTVWCPITTEHNRATCVYAHNIQDYRRSPKIHYYQPIECQNWRKNDNVKSVLQGGCSKGMDCTKCHGWKQREFHPLVYCKNVDIDKEKELGSKEGANKCKGVVGEVGSNKDIEMLQKKLGTNFCTKTNLQSIVQKQLNKTNLKNHMYTAGVPFFQDNKPRQIKSKSEKGQAKTTQEQNLSQVQERGGSVMTTKSIQMKNKNNYVHYTFDSEDPDDNLFKVFQSGNERTCDQKGSHPNMTEKNDSQHGKDCNSVHKKTTRTVSRSLGCNSRENSKYSKDFIQLLNPQIVEILKDKNISQSNLISMREQGVKKIEQLSNSQKSLIIKNIFKLRDYHDEDLPSYDRAIVNYFAKYGKMKTLVKFKSKNVKQEKLLHLSSELQNLSFLSESEKEEVPKIITEFKVNKEFEQLNHDISRVIANEGIQLQE